MFGSQVAYKESPACFSRKQSGRRSHPELRTPRKAPALAEQIGCDRSALAFIGMVCAAGPGCFVRNLQHGEVRVRILSRLFGAQAEIRSSLRRMIFSVCS